MTSFGFAVIFLRGEKLLRLERRHAAHPGGGDGLAEHLVLDVAGGVDPRNLGRRRQLRTVARHTVVDDC